MLYKAELLDEWKYKIESAIHTFVYVANFHLLQLSRAPVEKEMAQNVTWRNFTAVFLLLCVSITNKHHKTKNWFKTYIVAVPNYT